MKRSLLLRLGIAMATIFALAVIGMLSSVFIADTSEGFAAAINQAGTLRMQSYRIASSMANGIPGDMPRSGEVTRKLVAEFERRLFSPRIHTVLTKGPSESVTQAYNRVEKRWQWEIHPNLKVYLELTSAAFGERGIAQQIAQQRHYYLSHVDSFVDNIHHFVEALELDAEAQNRQLRLIQLVALMLTLFVALVSIYLTKRTVLNPLKDLLVCARAARRGDFSVRSHHSSEDELGQLGDAFNVMAADLSKLYEGLEARVREKTLNLERSNRSLELLYITAKRFSDSSLSDEVLKSLIHDIEQAMGVRSGTICLGQVGDRQAFRLASTSPVDIERQISGGGDCSRCLGNGETHTFKVDCEGGECVNVFSTAIRDQQQQYGVLLVEFNVEQELEEWQQRLLETVASHIAMAINLSQRVSQNRMLSLLEERSVIARELHDSLAQSLSYLKIQVSRLEKAVSEEQAKDDLLLISGVLRSALNGAYRQLRELLTTFRLRMSEAGLGAALDETVREYRERGGLEIELIDRIANCRFSPNAEIHVIQIIREALSNVIRHANATRALVKIECDMDGIVTILVEDDGVGIGIDEEGDMMQHYGLPIMQERANWLGAELMINEPESGGTRVLLSFSIADSDHTLSHENLIQKISYE